MKIRIFLVVLTLFAVVLGLVIALDFWDRSSREEVLETQSALGVTFDLVRASPRQNDQVEVTIVARWDPAVGTIVLGDIETEAGDPYMEYWSEGECSEQECVHKTTMQFQLPRSSNRVTLVQKLHRVQPEKNVRFEFHDIRANDLPRSIEIQGATVTLQALHPGTRAEDRRWDEYVTMGDWKEGSPAFGVEVHVEYPNGVVEGKNAFLVEADGQEHWMSAIRTDVANRIETTVTYTGAYKRSLLNRLLDAAVMGLGGSVTIFSESSITRYTRGNGSELYLFGTLQDTAEQFSFFLDVTLPPDEEDKAEVVFDNIVIR